jgi:hypothetical protein
MKHPHSQWRFFISSPFENLPQTILIEHTQCLLALAGMLAIFRDRTQEYDDAN